MRIAKHSGYRVVVRAGDQASLCHLVEKQLRCRKEVSTLPHDGRSESTYEGSTEGVGCASLVAGVSSKSVGGFESFSSSCFGTTDDSVFCGFVSLVLAAAPPLPPPPPPRARVLPLGLGGMVTRMYKVLAWVIHVAKVVFAYR